MNAKNIAQIKDNGKAIFKNDNRTILLNSLYCNINDILIKKRNDALNYFSAFLKKYVNKQQGLVIELNTCF